jgi:hypothetical protein
MNSNNEQWLYRITWNFAEVMDYPTLIWLPGCFGLWVIVTRLWNRSRNQNQTLLKKNLGLLF